VAWRQLQARCGTHIYILQGHADAVCGVVDGSVHLAAVRKLKQLSEKGRVAYRCMREGFRGQGQELTHCR
jgi:hypothetical protein